MLDDFARLIHGYKLMDNREDASHEFHTKTALKDGRLSIKSSVVKHLSLEPRDRAFITTGDRYLIITNSAQAGKANTVLKIDPIGRLQIRKALLQAANMTGASRYRMQCRQRDEDGISIRDIRVFPMLD